MALQSSLPVRRLLWLLSVRRLLRPIAESLRVEQLRIAANANSVSQLGQSRFFERAPATSAIPPIATELLPMASGAAIGVCGPESPAPTAPCTQRRGPVQWSVSRPHCSRHDANPACIIGDLKSRAFHRPFWARMCDLGHISVVGNPLTSSNRVHPTLYRA